MSNNYEYNDKRENILELIVKNWAIIIVFPSIFGMAFIWLYLRKIESSVLFSQTSFSSHGLSSITLFFIFLFFILSLPSLSMKYLFVESDEFYKFVIKTSLNKWWYVLLPSVSMLSILAFLYFYKCSDCDDIEKYISAVIIIFFYCYYFYLIYKNNNGNKLADCNKVVVQYSLIYILFSYTTCFFLYLLSFVSTGGNYEFFFLLSLYFAFLCLSNFLFIHVSDLKLSLPLLGIFFLGFFLFLIHHGDGFKFQRIILRPIGIAQQPSESGWYLLKNGDFLELIESNKYKKRVRTINERTYTYINGYLILNIGNIRVICPDDFETIDNQKANDQNLDFSRCLSLTSEDIKFMKRGLPNNDKRLDDNKKANVSKETENSKKIKGNKN